MSSRKRRAPGASPQAPTQAYQQDINVPNDTYMSWSDPSMNADLNGFGNPSLYDTYGTNVGAGHNRVVSLEDGSDMNMGQLVRRNPNQQLAPAPRRNQWDEFLGPPQQWEAVDDEEELEQKAAVAKKDAQAKRKQIPPFVQKLSSFLDNNKNENLIRWSDDGNSFIVLDEDEFARTLIPELFKHNNYASFVRQLNMYGFHKKVGLSDNSMKASETKAKAPSEYYNKYFKRGRPELLWLIQKPKNPPTAPKRKREEDGKGDSDDERKYVQDTGGGGYVEELAVRNNEQMAMIPRSEYNSLRVEVTELQQQQKLISNVLSQIKRQNEELYSRATSFQALHDRHENSINAILTFLATFYNRSLEGNTGGMNLSDMFPAARQQPHGNVVDVDDFQAQELSKSSLLPRSKKPLAILPAPPTPQQDSLSPTATGRATTLSPNTRPTASPVTRPSSKPSVFKPAVPQSKLQSTFGGSQTRDALNSAPLKVDSPSTLTPRLENDEIMSAIQNVNANANSRQSPSQAPQFDFPAALSNYQTQDGNVPLTPQQRSDALSHIANNISAQNTDNALTNPEPEMTNLMNDLYRYQATQQQLELLQKMSDEQNSRVQSIQERLIPHSPTGQIPGLTDNSYFGNAAALGDPGQYDLDLDSFVQDQDYFPNDGGTATAQQQQQQQQQQANGNGNGAGSGNNDDVSAIPDFNFDTPSLGFDGTGDGADAFNFDTADTKPSTFSSRAGHGETGLLSVGGDNNGNDDAASLSENRIESLASSGAPSPSTPTVEEVEDEALVKRSPKRRRK